MANSGQVLIGIRRVIYSMSLLGVRRLILLITALCLVALAALFVYEPQRSFLIEAETRSVELTFVPGANTWRFPEAVVCAPLSIPRRVPDANCGLAAEAKSERGELIIAWESGTTVALRSTPQGGLYVDVRASRQTDLAKGSVIRITSEDVAAIGALTFAATVLIGEDMTSGLESYLVEGRWEARETGFVISAFRSLTEIVKSGSLSLGTQVEVFNEDRRARSFGHLIFGERGVLHANVLTEAGDTALSIRHFGLEEPVRIEPDWMDLTLSSPLILAIGILLAMLAAVSQIVSDTSSSVRRGETAISNVDRDGH